MVAIKFREHTVVYAKDQPEYLPLPAYSFGDAQGRIACCYKLSWRERLTLLITGRIWHQILTFGGPLQPQRLSIEKPEMAPKSESQKVQEFVAEAGLKQN